MKIFKTAKGIKFECEDRPFGKGGEGIVYKQYDKFGGGDIGDLAKIFLPGKLDGKREKIKTMLSISPPQPSYSYAWPKDMLFDTATGNFCGYVMYLKLDKKELGEIYGSDSVYRSRKTWNFFVESAKNLAKAVAGVHAINQVIGDLNDKNIFVDTENAEITLIDCDSFHIAGHRCVVGMAEYIAPEIQGKNFRDADLPTFTEHTDMFSLAVLIFKLLMNGLHPFNSSWIDEMSIEDNIRFGRVPCFEKAKKGNSSEPPYAPSVNMLPSGLNKLFKRAFINGASSPKKRPTAKEFYDELEKLAKNIKTCGSNDNHKLPKDATGCPWCEVESKMRMLGGRSLLDDSVLKDTDSNDVALAMSVGGAGALPAPVSKIKRGLAVAGCVLIMLIAAVLIFFGFLLRMPWILLALAIIAAIAAILRLPKLNYENSFSYAPTVQTYLPVKLKLNNNIRFTLVPRWALGIFNILCMAVMFSLAALIVLSVFLLFSSLWAFIGLAILSVFGAMFIVGKRTLWQKTFLGIVMGVVGIAAILSSFGFLIILLF